MPWTIHNVDFWQLRNVDLQCEQYCGLISHMAAVNTSIINCSELVLMLSKSYFTCCCDIKLNWQNTTFKISKNEQCVTGMTQMLLVQKGAEVKCSRCNRYISVMLTWRHAHTKDFEELKSFGSATNHVWIRHLWFANFVRNSNQQRLKIKQKHQDMRRGTSNNSSNLNVHIRAPPRREADPLWRYSTKWLLM